MRRNVIGIWVFGVCSVFNFLFVLVAINMRNGYLIGWHAFMFAYTTIGFFVSLKREHARISDSKGISE